MKSFAGGVKDALVLDGSLRTGSACCQKAALTGFLLASGSITLLGGGAYRLSMKSASPGIIRLMVKRFYGALSLSPGIRILRASRLGGRRAFEIRLDGEDAKTALDKLSINPLDQAIPRHCMLKKCCRQTFLRYVFLGCGAITAPESGYLIEFSLQDEKSALALLEFVKAYFALTLKITERRGAHIVYTKEYESVVGILSLIGASAAILEMENTRILRDARNRANRAANCDSANVTKIITAADRQQRAIELIDRTQGISSLPESLREIALCRITYPDLSLEELGQRLSPPVGKSGVYHRLRRIVQLAESMADLCPMPKNTNEEELS